MHRPSGLGLGAVRKAELTTDKKRKPKYIKPGQSREKKDLVAAPTADGHARHVKTISEKLVEREVVSMKPGNYAIMAAGPHKGLAGKIVKLRPPRHVDVKLELSGQVGWCSAWRCVSCRVVDHSSP